MSKCQVMKLSCRWDHDLSDLPTGRRGRQENLWVRNVRATTTEYVAKENMWGSVWRAEGCENVSTWLEGEMDWEVKGITESPLKGPKGNKEFLIYACKRADVR